MAITSFQVQNILRTYAKQLSRGQRLARHRATSQPPPSDQVNISIEARRKQVIEKITSEIVTNIGSRLPGISKAMGGVESQALRQLSQEYGKELDIYQDERTGRLLFKVIDPNTREVAEKISPEESTQLQERLFVITQQIIDQNMI
jgi:hypothetical protein